MRALVCILALVAVVAAKPWGQGRWVMTLDNSNEHGFGPNYSAEYVRPVVATGGAATGRTGASVAGRPQTYSRFNTFSSEESFLPYAAAGGMTHGQRVQALSNVLNGRVISYSDEMERNLFRTNLQNAQTQYGAENVYVGDSNEIYYVPGAQAATGAGAAGQGVQTAKK